MKNRRCEETFEQKRIAVSKVNQRWVRFDGVPFGQLGILNFHQVNAKHVALVVDLFQSFQNLVAYVTILFIWNRIIFIHSSNHRTIQINYKSYKSKPRGTEFPRQMFPTSFW